MIDSRTRLRAVRCTLTLRAIDLDGGGAGNVRIAPLHVSLASYTLARDPRGVSSHEIDQVRRLCPASVRSVLETVLTSLTELLGRSYQKLVINVLLTLLINKCQ